MDKMPRWFTMVTSTDFLLEHVYIDTITGIVAAMLLSILLSLIFELLNVMIYRQRRKTNNANKRKITRHTGMAVLSCIKMMATLTSYIIMLSVMTLNVWLLVSAILGSGIAHFIIRPFVLKCVDGHNGIQYKDTQPTIEQEPLHDFVNEMEQSVPMNKVLA